MDSMFDIIIFGATGFTGKYVVEECTRNVKRKWAIAGRCIEKMKTLLQMISLKTGVDVTNIPIIIADCNDVNSMNNMAKKGRVIINCSGPYRFYGESVVKACIEEGSDYIDVSGEPEFMEKMQLEYFDLARSMGCYIVNSCGMDSVPVDVGVIHFINNFEGQVNYVEGYMRISSNSNKYEPITNYTTWESAVHGFSNVKSLMDIRKKLFANWKKLKPEPSIPSRSTVHRSEIFDNKDSIPFPGADRSVVVRTQMFLLKELNMRPVQFNPYLICDSKIILLALMVVGYFLQTLTKYEFGRKLLLKYPAMFSLGMMKKGGPSEEVQALTTATFKFYGEGWSKEILEKHTEPKTITEPTDSYMITSVEVRKPAYGFTAMCVVQCALILLTERDKLPSRGGVYTPGYAFYHTSIVQRLAERSFQFQIIEKGPKQA